MSFNVRAVSSTLLPTTTAPPVNPGLSQESPYPDETTHIGLAKTLLVLLIELAFLAGTAVLTRYTVQHRSGLNEPDKLRRIWARAPEIRFQPVLRPMLFAVVTSFGAETVIHSLISVVLCILGFGGSLGAVLSVIFIYVSLGFSALIAILVYRATGGTNYKLLALSNTAFGWFMTGILANLALSAYSVEQDFTSPFVMFWLVALGFLIMLVLFQVPMYIWGSYMRLPPTASLIYNNAVVPNWVKLDRTMLMVAGPLAIVHLLSLWFYTLASPDTYLLRVVSAFATLMLLSACALASIISVNRALLANEFQWQWRAFLTPAVPLLAVDVVVRFIEVVLGREPFRAILFKLPSLFLSYGSSGALGAYVYLKLAELHAQAHIDDDVLAQDDLLAEFEEDEDNEELEV